MDKLFPGRSEKITHLKSTYWRHFGMTSLALILTLYRHSNLKHVQYKDHISVVIYIDVCVTDNDIKIKRCYVLSLSLCKVKSAGHHTVQQLSREPWGLQQEGAGRVKGGKVKGGGAFLAKQKELLEISTFLWQGSCRGGAKRWNK